MQVWHIAKSMAGQLRVDMGRVTGMDMNVAFRMADAYRIDAIFLAELFPTVEATIVNETNKMMEGDSDGW